MDFRRSLFTAAALLMLAGISTGAQATVAEPVRLDNGMSFGKSYQNDVSMPLYYLPPPLLEVGKATKSGPKNPRLPLLNHVDKQDPVVQNLAWPEQMPSFIVNFDGVGYPGVSCSCAPPDTNGAVGTTQYVQNVNDGFQVFDKANGNSLLGPIDIGSIWSGFGGVCETNGDGDPVVLFDKMSNRWLISQFAGAGVPTDECVAISQSDDATGAWNRYAFHLGSNFYDYPHLGVWPDGYYMSMNVFNSAGTAFLGPQAFVFDRNAMLVGTPGAVFIAAPLGAASDETFLPADLDGANLPPNGAPNPFVEWPSGGTYKIRHFHADFVTPGNSTFTLFASPPAAGFTVLCLGTRDCVPQVGVGNSLDGIGDRLMFRVAYRNFGDHEALVGNYTVSSAGVAGIRWFEMRSVTSGTPVVFQESTYQPDTTWRWLGSIAQDSAGNIALGFSASDATIKPQIRYAGRLASDPINQLAQGETHLFDGAGVQNGGLNRWGDYSALTVDPIDDCTFWYTNEYIPSDGSFNWQTRIGSFRFAECGTPGFALSAAPQSAQICAGTQATTTITVGSVNSFNSAVSLAATNVPSPATYSFSPPTVPSLPGTSTLTIGNTAGLASGQYVISANGSAAGADPRSTNLNLHVYAAVAAAPTQSAPANGATSQPVRPTFSWSGGDAANYTLQIATDPGFTNIAFSATVTTTSTTPNVDLVSSTPYFWRVVANNTCGSSVPSATFTFTTLALAGDCAAGTTAQSVYNYGFESGLNGWTLGSGSTGNTWADNATAHSGSHSWKANDSAVVSDQRLVSPSIVLPTGESPLTLSFWHKRDIESSGSGCWDGGILEISTNGGSTFAQIANGNLVTDPYNGLVSSSFANPLGGKSAWCNQQDWTRSVVDVNAYAGSTVQFRYRLGSDSSVSKDGWYLDDFSVQGCAASANPPIADATPSQFDFAVSTGGNTSGLLNIANTGGDSLVWSNNEAAATCASPADVPWLSVSAASGLVNGGSAQDVTIGVDAASLAAGVYSAHVCLTTNDSTHALVDVPVNLTVVAAPTLAKAFTPASVTVGAPSTATVTLSNTNVSAISLTAALTDSLPTGLVVAATPNASATCSAGVVTANAGDGSFSLGSGAQIPGAGSCTVKVDVVAASVGAYINTLAAGSLQTEAGDTTADATATLMVLTDRIFCDAFEGVACGPFAPTTIK